MSLLPIFGGGTAYNPPPAATTNTTEPQPGQTTNEPEDTSPPAPAQSSNESTSTNTSEQTVQPSHANATSAQTGQAAAFTPLTGPAPARDAVPTEATLIQSVVEAQFELPKITSEDDARRLAEAAQQHQRLELLIANVSKQPAIRDLVAPAAGQAEVGNVETDGLPV